MRLTYIYHSGFAIETEAATIIIDYYKDSSESTYNKGVVHDRLLNRPGKIYVLATHFHPDHFNREILLWKKQRPDIIYIFSKDILKQRRAEREDGVYIKQGEVYEDTHLRIEAFGSTDSGVSFLITIQGMQIFHAGDLNNWHWSEESTKEEIRKAEGDFLAEVKNIKRTIPEMTLAMFPVDPRLGKEYTKGAEQFLEQIKTSIFAPMHFGDDHDGGNAFRQTAERYGTRFLTIRHRGETFDIK